MSVSHADRTGKGTSRELPAGTVTFVFTDIEGSTKLAHELATERWGDVLTDHARILRAAVSAADGVEVRTEGDSFFFVFPVAGDALQAVVEAQRRLQPHGWPHGAAVRVRIGMHTGEGTPATPGQGADYVGYAVHRAARVAAAGHGGQVLLSSATRALVDQLPAGVTIRDLGEHRLKDMTQPERIHQLVIEGLQDTFPPLRTLERAPHNLPVQMTSFIGRQKELAEARELLARSRLLTLIGPGGTGKSRLSLEVAAEALTDFPDGVWFVRLAPVTDPALVASEIAHTLGLVVPPSRTPLQQLMDHLKEKRALLVLDNFEQVVGAAPDMGEILRAAPQAKILVSSRAALRVAGEQEYPVPPMVLPDPEDVPDVSELSHAEAVQLFVERARAARPDFMLSEANSRAVVGILAQLDGLPLAIELAAARVKILTPQAILDRLASGLGLLQSSARDLDARQQTLRGAIGWSYDLLDEGLQRALRRLSVFRGGAQIEQIEAVVGPAEEIGRDVLDALSELVDQSLLRQSAAREEPRFGMLETIREFAREKLEESGEAAEIGLRHARAYLALAESFAPRLFGKEQKELLDRLELEMGNLRAAVDSCSQAGNAERVTIGLRLVSALWRFWQMRGHLAEGRQRSERILALPGADADPDVYLGAVEALGGIAYWQADMEATEIHYRKRLELARASGDRLKLASALYDLSFVYTVPQKGLDQAERLLNEALEIFRAAGDRAGVAKTLWGLSGLYFGLGQWEKAGALLPEVVQRFREMDNRFGLGWALHSMGVVAARLGDLGLSREAFLEGMALFREAEDLSGIVLFVYDFAELAATQRRDARALRLYGASVAMQERYGVQLADVWLEENAQWAAATRELLQRGDPVQREALIAAGRELSQEEAIAYALGDED